MSCTEEQILESMRASSMALSPPPITAQVLFMKRYPSHAAQLETPWPLYSYSPSVPSHLLSAPIARMIVADFTRRELFVTISNGDVDTFTLTTASSHTSVLKLRACFFITLIIFIPLAAGMPG